MSSNYTEQGILKDLDQGSFLNGSKFWLQLNAPYIYLSGSYIDLFADNDRWAIVFVMSGFDGQSDLMSIQLFYFGNCLSNLDFIDSIHTTNLKSFYLNKLEDLNSVFHNGILDDGIDSIKVRNKNYPIERNIVEYKALRIPIDEENGLDDVSVTRYLNETYPSLFEATNQEIRTCIPKDLPELFKIREWHHNENQVGITCKPSESEAFKLIAKILVTKNTTLWKPTEKPNNDWRNWPESGNL